MALAWREPQGGIATPGVTIPRASAKGSVLNKRLAIRAVADLAARDASRHFLVTGIPTVFALQLLTRGTTYIAPPMGGRDASLLQACQDEFATWALCITLWLGWLVSRANCFHVSGRHTMTWRGVVVDALALMGSVTLTVLLWTVFNSGGYAFGIVAVMSMPALLTSLAPMALAPGLVRLRISAPTFLMLVLILLLGLVGFFGRYSPMPADTVLYTTGVGIRWLADALAGAACLLISLTIAYPRSPNTRCGSAS